LGPSQGEPSSSKGPGWFDQLGKLITSATTSPKEAWIAPPGVQDEDGKAGSSYSA